MPLSTKVLHSKHGSKESYIIYYIVLLYYFLFLITFETTEPVRRKLM